MAISLRMVAVFLCVCLVSSSVRHVFAGDVLGAPESHMEHFRREAERGIFKCLSRDKEIPFSRVNDDYCDCPDGSDEPGTSACTSQLLASQESPEWWRFPCASQGILAKLIPLSSVNDGICDCCDGSDEPAAFVACANTCGEEEKAEKKRLEEERIVREKSLQLKREVEATAVQQRAAMKECLAARTGELADLRKAREDSLVALKELTEKEAEENKKIKEKRKEEFAAFEEKVKTYNSESEASGVTCKEWSQTSDCDPNGEIQYENSKGCHIIVSQGDSGYCSCVDKDGKNIKYNFTCEHEDLRCHHTCSHSGEVGIGLSLSDYKEEEEPFTLPETDELRRKVEDIERQVSSLSTELEFNKTVLSRDLNTEDLLRALPESSYSLDVGDHTYELQLFSRVHQYPKETNHGPCTGKWGHFGKSTYAMWSSGENYFLMNYTNGEACPNGVERITEVSLVCGPENKLVRAGEPSMCKYEMTLSTPIACT